MKFELEKYNKDIALYYKQRTGGKREDRWTQMMAKNLLNAKRLYLKSYLARKKLHLE
jgi:FMN reductase (NADPH)